MKNFNDLLAELEEAQKLVSIDKSRKIKSLEASGRRIQKIFEILIDLANPTREVSFKNKVFKAVRHKFTSNRKIADNKPLSTAGSHLFSGRFHLRGTHQTLYFADSAKTMDAEVRLDGIDMPFAIWPVNVSLQQCLDLSDYEIAGKMNILLHLILQLEWKQFNDVLLIDSYSQMLGAKVFSLGFEGILVPSARRPDGLNLVVFPENLKLGSSIRLCGDPKELREKNRILVKNQAILARKGR